MVTSYISGGLQATSLLLQKCHSIPTMEEGLSVEQGQTERHLRLLVEAERYCKELHSGSGRGRNEVSSVHDKVLRGTAPKGSPSWSAWLRGGGWADHHQLRPLLRCSQSHWCPGLWLDCKLYSRTHTHQFYFIILGCNSRPAADEVVSVNTNEGEVLQFPMSSRNLKCVSLQFILTKRC